ncbi:hypothetical protein BDN72DRAFT_866442, partial [Pluteus cervinus]
MFLLTLLMSCPQALLQALWWHRDTTSLSSSLSTVDILVDNLQGLHPGWTSAPGSWISSRSSTQTTRQQRERVVHQQKTKLSTKRKQRVNNASWVDCLDSRGLFEFLSGRLTVAFSKDPPAIKPAFDVQITHQPKLGKATHTYIAMGTNHHMPPPGVPLDLLDTPQTCPPTPATDIKSSPPKTCPQGASSFMEAFAPHIDNIQSGILSLEADSSI